MKPRLILLSIIWSFSTCFADVRLVCFYNSFWAKHRTGNGSLTVDNINPHLCTHLVYEKAYITLYRSLKEIITVTKEPLKQFVALKKHNPKLKVLIDLEVDRDENFQYAPLMNNDSLDTIVATVLTYLDEFGFDGVHLCNDLRREHEIAPFMNLIRALSEAFKPRGYLLGGFKESDKNLDVFENESDIPRLITYFDYIIVEAHGFHREYNTADHPSALYPHPWHRKQDCADFLITYLSSKGFPANKIIIGISLYGSSWKITTNSTNPPVKARGSGSAGKITKRSGWLAYYEICHAVKFNGWQVFHDPLQKMGPYAVSPMGDNRTWVGYDDPEMAIVKAKYALSNKLGGIAIRDITLDDFRNVCGEGNYPVTSAVWHTLFSSKIKKQLHLKWMFLKKIDNFILKLTGKPSS